MKPVFAQRLNGLRRESGLSQKQTADDLGVSQALLSHYENGVREPKLEFIQKTCDYYNVSTDYLLGRTDKKKMQWSDLLESKNKEIQRCIKAAAIILAMLSEIDDEQVHIAVSRYLNYSIHFVLNVLGAPKKPYEPLFDAAIKTAEANLLKAAAKLSELDESSYNWPDVKTLQRKYPDQYRTVKELDNFIKDSIAGISGLT